MAPPASGECSHGSRMAREGTHHRGARFQPLAHPSLRTGDASVHRSGVRDQRLQSAADAAARHHQVPARGLEADRARLDLHHRHLLPRRLGGRVRQVGSSAGATQVRLRRCVVLGPRLSDRRARHPSAQHLARLPGLWCARRLWPRHRLHHARVHPDLLVSRSPRHGDGYGHHGVWRRRAGRVTPLGAADEAVCVAHVDRRRRDVDGARAPLPRVHVDRCLWLPAAGAGLEARRLGARRRQGQRPG
jgi:hypothetical protein